MPSLLQLVNEQFTKWVEEENRQLRIIEEAAASLVAAAKTHLARKPHLKRMRKAQKDLESASEQCILYTKIAENLSDNISAESHPDIIEQLKQLFRESDIQIEIDQLKILKIR